jgi:sulfite reductase (NADPH) hemoprotein beta-component
VILSDITDKDKADIDKILDKYKIKEYTESISAIRRNSMACVALNTCPLAFAEAQRYLPSLISKIEPLLKKHGLEKEEIIIRMTGCPTDVQDPISLKLALSAPPWENIICWWAAITRECALTRYTGKAWKKQPY